MEALRHTLHDAGERSPEQSRGTISSPAERTISVIIPVHNGGADFRRCLVSLAAAVSPPREIIIVADGDTDGSWRLADSFGAQVLRLDGPGGPARARNLGARKAQGDILFFLDIGLDLGIYRL